MKNDLNKVSKTFCIFAWNQLHITPIGVVKPCCIFDGALKDEDQKAIRINDGDLESIWNGKGFKDLRLKMINGEHVSECVKCYEEERVSSSSDRIRGLQSLDVHEKMLQNTSEDGSFSTLPHILNLKIGNKCNLKCRMCQPLDSAMVDDEFSQISKLDPRFRSFDNANAFDYNYDESPIQIAGDWISDELAKNNILELLKRTDMLSLAGGETTFTQEAIDLLVFCVENDLAKNIEVVMSSNLTRLSDSLMKLMAEFKIFRIVASIDGVENLAEYIRYPTKWNVVKANFIKLLNAPENVIPVVAPTIQIYNILNIVEVFEFIESVNSSKWISGKNPACHLTILFDPQHLSIRHLPLRIKKIALDRLLEFQKKSKFLAIQRTYMEQFDLLVDTLKQEEFDSGSGFTSKDYLSHFLQYTNDLDKQRHQRMEDYIPELYMLLLEEKIIPKYPKEDPRNYTYFKYRDTGFKWHSENRTAEALSMFTKAYEMFTDDPDLLYSMGNCHKQLGNREMAYSFFKQLEKISSEVPYNLKEIGIILIEDKKFSDALSYLKRAYVKSDEEDKKYIQKLISECEVALA